MAQPAAAATSALDTTLDASAAAAGGGAAKAAAATGDSGGIGGSGGTGSVMSATAPAAKVLDVAEDGLGDEDVAPTLRGAQQSAAPSRGLRYLLANSQQWLAYFYPDEK